MDKVSGEGHTPKWMLALIGLPLLTLVTGCVVLRPEGNVELSYKATDTCKELAELGYTQPYLDQDVKDIEALGLSRCATYMEQKLRQEKTAKP